MPIFKDNLTTMKATLYKRSTWLMLLALFNNSALAETGAALKDDQLRAAPFADAQSTGSIKRGQSVEINEKKGAWLNISAGSAKGWVRLLSVKRGTSSSSTASASDVLNVASGRAGTGKVVATTGIRGLSAEELKSASFNEAEIQQLERYTQTPEQGQSFAAQGGLNSVNFKTLKAPKGAQ